MDKRGNGEMAGQKGACLPLSLILYPFIRFPRGQYSAHRIEVNVDYRPGIVVKDGRRREIGY